MNILFLFCSLPNLSDDSTLFSSLINEFKRQGHNVFVSAKGKNIEKTAVVTENGIDVLRIKCPDFTGVTNNIKKAIAYQEYVIKQKRFIKKYFGREKIDLIVSHSLPPELAYVVSGLKRHFNCPFYLIQTDFTWQDAVAFGFFRKNGPIAKYYRFWEKRMLELADFIACPTQGNIDFIRAEYPKLNGGRFHVLRFWQKEMTIIPDTNAKAKVGLDGKFVVIYGGSVGKAQKIEHVVELADACKEYKDMIFLILGRGAYLPVIKEMVCQKQLNNVRFMEFMPQDQYLQFLSSCDVGLIVLNEKMATPNFPSKSLSYFNLKVPVLAALDYVTDFGQILDENHAGLWAHSDDVASLKEKLLEYRSEDFRNKVKENAYSLYISSMTPEMAYENIIKHVN